MLSYFDNISLFKDLLKRMILQDTYEEVQYLNTASKLCNVLSENMKEDFPFLIRIPVRIFNLITWIINMNYSLPGIVYQDHKSFHELTYKTVELIIWGFIKGICKYSIQRSLKKKNGLNPITMYGLFYCNTPFRETSKGAKY